MTEGTEGRQENKAGPEVLFSAPPLLWEPERVLRNLLCKCHFQRSILFICTTEMLIFALPISLGAVGIQGDQTCIKTGEKNTINVEDSITAASIGEYS